MLSNIFAVLFYGTLFLYIFIKIYNSILIKKYNCKDSYKKQKDEIKQVKFVKIMKIILIISCVGLIIFIPYLIADFIFSFAFMIVDKGSKLNEFFDMTSIVLYSIYFIFITYKLYINILLNKFLQTYKKV